MADDDEEAFGSLYEDGHWAWDSNTEALIFVSDRPPVLEETFQMPTKAPTGAVEFKDDIDLIEQIRYRRRYQRKLKPGQPDIITLQDVKDIAIYTAPINILSPALINMLHLSTTERFLRAMILCMQYYLQIADEMANRMLELDIKVRTPQCAILEMEFSENLADLRLLVAKEYGSMLIGGGDTRKYHHMGPDKRRKSLSEKDARLFETLLRMCVQIVWLALGRKAFNQIELEMNRIFKSEIFNVVEHNLKTGYLNKMSPEEKSVLLGQCLKHDQKLNSRSPMMNEVFCNRDVDFRIMGLGVIKCTQMTSRLQYMLLAITASEEHLPELGVVVGILGSPKANFDTTLRLVKTQSEKSKASVSSSIRTKSNVTSASGSKKSTFAVSKIYEDIVLPMKETKASYFPPSFPDQSDTIRSCSEVQRRRWLNRLQKIMHPH